jgi:hypothetical protein
MIEFGIYVEQGHRRYKAWIIGDRENTEVSAPTRGGVVKRLADSHLDDTEPAGALGR